jgi:hypothetical protein
MKVLMNDFSYDGILGGFISHREANLASRLSRPLAGYETRYLSNRAKFVSIRAPQIPEIREPSEENRQQFVGRKVRSA